MKNTWKAIKLVIPISPFRMTVYLILSLPGAILPVVMLSLQRQIVDSAANLSQALSILHYMKPVLVLVGTYMVMKLFRLISNQYMEFGYFRYVFMGLDARIHKKSAELPLEYYDSSQYYKVVEQAKQATMFLVFTANLVIMSFVLICNLLSVGGYLVALHPLLLVFVVLVSLPVVIEKLQGAKYQSAFFRDTVQASRRKKNALNLLSVSDRKKELAHHGAGRFVADKCLAACGEINTKEWKHISQIGRTELIFAVTKALFHGIAVFIMVGLLISNGISIGDFSILLTSFATLTNAFTQLFQHAGEILQTSVMSDPFFALMELGRKDGIISMEAGEEFARLEHVSYKYPNAEEFALKDISLSVRKGEKIAIVGENGAGKTTLAKLLSGFLLPTEGVAKFGGRPRSQLLEDSIYAHISAVYQEFGRYKMTLAQNVYLSDTQDAPDGKRICSALDWAGISFSDHPEEILLGKEFGGTEMSGGQWQRIALARSYYRNRPILFLDEPTAAIDPLEEMTLYGKLNELAKDRTVILATHRLGAVRDANKIIVLDSGCIVEMGNFTRLMERKGHFYHIWQEQVQWYRMCKEKPYGMS